MAEKTTKEIVSELIDYKKKSGNDNIFFKEKIKKRLINNPSIIHVLDNKDLDEDSPDDYLGVNIFPYYLILDAQTQAANYICFETTFTEQPRYNDTMKIGQIMFYVLCDGKNVYDKETGVARHDLLTALIMDEFNYTNFFGTQIKLVSDRPMAVDSGYVLRTLIFEQTTPNNITKSQQVINRLGG